MFSVYFFANYPYTPDSINVPVYTNVSKRENYLGAIMQYEIQSQNDSYFYIDQKKLIVWPENNSFGVSKISYCNYMEIIPTVNSISVGRRIFAYITEVREIQIEYHDAQEREHGICLEIYFEIDNWATYIFPSFGIEYGTTSTLPKLLQTTVLQTTDPNFLKDSFVVCQEGQLGGISSLIGNSRCYGICYDSDMENMYYVIGLYQTQYGLPFAICSEMIKNTTINDYIENGNSTYKFDNIDAVTKAINVTLSSGTSFTVIPIGAYVIPACLLHSYIGDQSYKVNGDLYPSVINTNYPLIITLSDNNGKTREANAKVYELIGGSSWNNFEIQTALSLTDKNLFSYDISIGTNNTMINLPQTYWRNKIMEIKDPTPEEAPGFFITTVSTWGASGINIVMNVCGQAVDITNDFSIPIIQNETAQRMLATSNSRTLQRISQIGGVVAGVGAAALTGGAAAAAIPLALGALSVGQTISQDIETRSNPVITKTGNGDGWSNVHQTDSQRDHVPGFGVKIQLYENNEEVYNATQRSGYIGRSYVGALTSLKYGYFYRLQVNGAILPGSDNGYMIPLIAVNKMKEDLLRGVIFNDPL